MKIEITPGVLTEYRNENGPVKITIAENAIYFSLACSKLLAMQPGYAFVLEFEDGNLYYKDATDGFTVSPAGKHHVMKAYVKDIAKYISQFLKEKSTTYFFSVGELKMGRRMLTMISGKKRKA